MRIAFLLCRNGLSEYLRERGYRVVSPFRVPVGWVDIAAFKRGESVGIDFYGGNFESCAERLSSHPFTTGHIVGECEFCEGVIEGYDVLSGIRRAEEEVEGIRERYDDVSMETKAVEDSIAFLYIAGEIFEDKIEEYDFKPLVTSLPELKKYGFVVTHSRPKIGRRDFVTLSKDGVDVARRIILSRLVKFEDRLERMSENPLTYLLSLGITASMSVAESGFYSDERCDGSLKSILMAMNNFSIESYHFPCEYKGFTFNPKFLFAHFLVSTVLNGDALLMAKELSRMGLAYEVKDYTPFGDEVGRRYAVAKEALEVLMKFSYTHVDPELLNEFLAIVYPTQSSDVYPVIHRCREYFRKAEKVGVCKLRGSKIELMHDFEKYAKIRLSIIASKFLDSI